MNFIESGGRDWAAEGVAFYTGAELDLDAVIDLYRRSTLGARRPVDRPDIMAGMLAHAGLVITARYGEELIGIARTLTDRVYVAYLADLAVDAAWQRKGIGKELIRRTREALAPSCFLTLLAAPAADAYYERLGFERHPRAWTFPARESQNS